MQLFYTIKPSSIFINQKCFCCCCCCWDALFAENYQFKIYFINYWLKLFRVMLVSKITIIKKIILVRKKKYLARCGGVVDIEGAFVKCLQSEKSVNLMRSWVTLMFFKKTKNINLMPCQPKNSSECIYQTHYSLQA